MGLPSYGKSRGLDGPSTTSTTRHFAAVLIAKDRAALLTPEARAARRTLIVRARRETPPLSWSELARLTGLSRQRCRVIYAAHCDREWGGKPT